MGANAGVEVISLQTPQLEHLPKLLPKWVPFGLTGIISDPQTHTPLLSCWHLQQIVGCHLGTFGIRTDCLLLLLNEVTADRMNGMARK